MRSTGLTVYSYHGLKSVAMGFMCKFLASDNIRDINIKRSHRMTPMRPLCLLLKTQDSGLKTALLQQHDLLTIHVLTILDMQEVHATGYATIRMEQELMVTSILLH
jgi:hypothetical protein